jgi:hypothetical protein
MKACVSEHRRKQAPEMICSFTIQLFEQKREQILSPRSAVIVLITPNKPGTKKNNKVDALANVRGSTQIFALASLRMRCLKQQEGKSECFR